ncbi:MAG: hypothetical protein V4812_05165 [Pseudomonadota bacterium]
MTGWRLRMALARGRVERVEVWVLRGSGYAVRVLGVDGGLQFFEPAGGARLWPALAPLKARLRRCGVRQLLLLQRESHDEIIGRPVPHAPDPGLSLRL